MGSGSSKTECPVCPERPECSITISNDMKMHDILEPIITHFSPEDLPAFKTNNKEFLQASVGAFVYKALEQQRRRRRQQSAQNQTDNSQDATQPTTQDVGPSVTQDTTQSTTEGFGPFGLRLSNNMKLFIGLCILAFILLNRK